MGNASDMIAELPVATGAGDDVEDTDGAGSFITLVDLDGSEDASFDARALLDAFVFATYLE